MGILIGLVILLFLGGIVLLNMKSSSEGKSREVFLKELTDFLEGSLESIEGDSNEQSFRITFLYKGQEFVYEDFEAQGFRDRIYKAYLKAKTPDRLTITFSEKERSSPVRRDIFMASEVSTQYANEHITLQVPRYLKGLQVKTNDPAEANKFFNDHKVSSIFKKYKNVDNRGYPFLVISIIKGEVVLEFHSNKSCYPNVFSLRADMHSIDEHLERIITLIRKLKGES